MCTPHSHAPNFVPIRTQAHDALADTQWAQWRDAIAITSQRTPAGEHPRNTPADAQIALLHCGPALPLVQTMSSVLGTSRLARLLLPAAITLLAACDAGTDDGVAGACVNLPNDEVLHIDSATGTNTGSVIGEITLSGFSIDNQSISAASVANQRSRNITVDDNALTCVLPCSFGTQEGNWRFGASADGFDLTPQEVVATYDRFVGGCPSYVEDGTQTDITLDESGA